MKHYIKLKNIAFLIAALLLLATGCKKDQKNSLNMDADVQIAAFTINGATATINQKTGEIEVQLPFGTNVTALAPTISIAGQASVTPASAMPQNFTGSVNYRVTNGNVYKDYTATVKIIPPLTAFSINGVTASIDHESKSIALILPDGTNLSSLTPSITVQPGFQITPTANTARDFSQPVTYVLSNGSASVTYTVTVISNSISEYAFIGVAPSRAAITNADEKAAADWFFTTYPTADYVSFQSIESGKKLSNYKIMWWHYDTAQDLPAAALTSTVTTALKNYRNNGGSLLLTTYAARYLETLGIIPAGLGPNNVFGDFLPAGFIETNNDWGICFKSHESHPIFQGVTTYEPGKAWLLEKGTFRLNHTAWWFLPDWGGYGNGANWRTQTGGINLASEAWDDALDGRVGIAEWPATGGKGKVVVITFGAYDWYSEPMSGASTTNLYLANIKKITQNTIDYLK